MMASSPFCRTIHLPHKTEKKRDRSAPNKTELSSKAKMTRAKTDLMMAGSDDRDAPSSGFYPDEEYSDETINVGRVSSFSINDVPNARTVVNVFDPDGFRFNSQVKNFSDDRLQQLIDRLLQAESGPLAVGHPGRRNCFAARAVRTSLRDYKEEVDRVFFSRNWDPPTWRKKKQEAASSGARGK
jgi:hypothetical protein